MRIVVRLAAVLVAAAAPPDPLELAQAFYSTRPRVERPQGGWQETPKGLVDLKASSCGECHPEIYQEWRVSTHAQAWTDRQFQAERAKSGNRWLCNNCHTPLLNQMELWAVGIDQDDVEKPTYVENPSFEPALREEGINCASCHVRGGFVEGPSGIQTEAHPTRKATRFTDEAICLECHQAVRSYPGKDFVCVFETGQEWREGPYSKTGQTCQSCHMQPVDRPQAVGAPSRSGRRHFWPGAGIYKRDGFGPPLDQLGPGLGVEVTPTRRELVLELENSAAGHLLPTGDPERFIMVTVSFFDSADRPTGDVHQTRIGQQWTWWPEPEKRGDNRLKPLEVRDFRVARPREARRWSVIAESHRISREALDYHRLAGYPASRVTHELSGELPE
jgi:hypothetical protein